MEITPYARKVLGVRWKNVAAPISQQQRVGRLSLPIQYGSQTYLGTGCARATQAYAEKREAGCVSLF
jgi:hypothetical protein